MGTATEQDQDASPHRQSTSSQNERKELPRKLKLLTSCALWYGTFALGNGFNTYGPALTTLQNKYETDDSTISKVFTILTGCYMIGALAAGLMFNYVNRQLAVILINALMAGMIFITPHCPTLTTFFVSAAIMGLCCGSYDAAQFVWMMEMMQKDCPPYVQGQHFCYALGTNLVSLIMAPFLDEEEDDDVTTTTTMSSLVNGTSFPILDENSPFSVVARKTEEHGAKLYIPYTIIGILVSITAISHLLLFIFVRYYPPPPEIMETETENVPKEINAEAVPIEPSSGFKIGNWSLWSVAKLRMVVLCCAFYGAYQGMEMCTFQFFPKFGQNSDLKLSESDSTYVLTGMTAAFAVGRGIAIIIVFKISTQLILAGNLVLAVVANVLLFGWAQSSLTTLWAASITFGLAFSSMYGSFSAYMERYILFTNFMGSLMIVCGSGVAAIYPIIIGNYIEDNPIVLSYTSGFSIVILILSFGGLSYLTHKDKTRY